MLLAGIDRLIIGTQFIFHILQVAVQIAGLLFGHAGLQIDASQTVNGISQAFKTDGDKAVDVQIQIGIEHGDRLLRPAVGIGRVGLAIRTVSQLQPCIPVNRDQFHLSGRLVNGAQDHGITAVIAGHQILFPGIHAENGDGGIVVHDPVRGRLAVDFGIDPDGFQAAQQRGHDSETADHKDQHKDQQKPQHGMGPFFRGIRSPFPPLCLRGPAFDGRAAVPA